MKNNAIKSFFLIGGAIFIAEFVLMSTMFSFLEDKVPPWGFAVLDSMVIALVTMAVIYIAQAKEWINYSADGRTEIIILKICAIVFCAEATVMFLLSAEAIQFHLWEQAVIDSLALAIITSSLVYWVIVRPNLVRRNKDVKQLLREMYTVNIMVFSSIAVLLLVLGFVVYKQYADISQDMLTVLVLIYITFLLGGGAVLWIMIKSESKKIIEFAKMNSLAFFDDLTNLGNKRYFDVQLDMMLKQLVTDGTNMALMFLDLDRFKPVNDTYGHEAGDCTLRAAARRITSCINVNDIACRIGGDEFAVILTNVESEEILDSIAHRIIKAFYEDFTYEEFKFNIGISIGICVIHADYRVIDILKHADNAMYKVKEEGGNSYNILY